MALPIKPVEENECPEIVTPSGQFGAFHSHPCRRPIKRDGLCGIHAAAKDRRAEASRKYAKESERRDKRNVEIEAASDAINALLGAELVKRALLNPQDSVSQWRYGLQAEDPEALLQAVQHLLGQEG